MNSRSLVQNIWCVISAVVLVAAFTPLSCVKKTAPVPWPDKNWPSATPESQGLDSNVLAEALRTLRRENINIHSILLIRNGYLVLNAAFYPYDGHALHDVASVTKSITATLVGQAAGEGILPPLKTPVIDVLDGSNWGEGWEEVSLENLVTMSSGVECGDPPLEETIFSIRRASDWVEAIQQLPVVEKPGHRFDYCSPNFHLLSAAISRASGMPVSKFARQRLFDPLGIKELQWPEDPQGINVGWGDLRLHPADMARIGYLYMNGGRWKDRQVLPRGWVKDAVKPRLPTSDGEADYGYGWWLAKSDFKGVYEARGRGGQGISVWPKMKILFVTTGGGYDRDVVVKSLLPAVKSTRSIPENPDAVKDLDRAVAEAAIPPEPEPIEQLPSRALSVSGVWFTLDGNALDLERFLLTFDNESDEASLMARVAGKDFSFQVGLDGVYRFSESSPSGDPAAVRGRWETADRFVLDYNEITRINRFRMEMDFSDEGVTLVFSEPTGQIAGKVRGKNRDL